MEPWEQVPHIWPSESRFWSYVRGALREGWSSHPVKLEFIRQHRIKVPNPNPNGRNATVFGMKCNRCEGEFPMPVTRKVKARIEKLTGEDYNYIEINHKTEAGTLTSKSDLGRFASNLLYVSFKDLESLCKKCHSIVTYSQRYGVSEEEAEVEKKAIQVMKEDEKQWLKERGVEPASNAKLRRAQVREVLSNER